MAPINGKSKDKYWQIFSTNKVKMRTVVWVGDPVNAFVQSYMCFFTPPLPILTTTKVSFSKVAAVFGQEDTHTQRRHETVVALSDSVHQSRSSLKTKLRRSVIKFPCCNIY